MPFDWFRRRDEVEVVDGDTVKRYDGRGGKEEFRLLEFDSPEVRKGSDLERTRGRQAAARLQYLLDNARRVKLVPGANSEGNKKHRNRRFARLYIDGEDVEDIAIREGWGVKFIRGEERDWGDPNFPFRVPEQTLRQTSAAGIKVGRATGNA